MRALYLFQQLCICHNKLQTRICSSIDSLARAKADKRKSSGQLTTQHYASLKKRINTKHTNRSTLEPMLVPTAPHTYFARRRLNKNSIQTDRDQIVPQPLSSHSIPLAPGRRASPARVPGVPGDDASAPNLTVHAPSPNFRPLLALHPTPYSSYFSPQEPPPETSRIEKKKAKLSFYFFGIMLTVRLFAWRSRKKDVGARILCPDHLVGCPGSFYSSRSACVTFRQGCRWGSSERA